MRAFIALELPEEIKKEVGKIQLSLKNAGVQARWVKPELSHLTLAFLGSITPNKLELIGNILEAVASQIKPVQLHFLKIGCFPGPTKARVIFIDLGGELGKLNALAMKIRKRLKKEKIWFDEKPFVSHITLARKIRLKADLVPTSRSRKAGFCGVGRIKKRQNLTLLIDKIKVKKEEFIASEVSLTKSTLTESGPIYTQFRCVSLA